MASAAGAGSASGLTDYLIIGIIIIISYILLNKRR
jgi:hypothetical protein